MLGMANKTGSAHVDLYINTCRHRHPLLSSNNTQEGELLQACCSDNCLFGRRETNAAGISLTMKQANRYDKKHYIPSVVFVASEANLPLTTCKVFGNLTQI